MADLRCWHQLEAGLFLGEQEHTLRQRSADTLQFGSLDRHWMGLDLNVQSFLRSQHSNCMRHSLIIFEFGLDRCPRLHSFPMVRTGHFPKLTRPPVQVLGMIGGSPKWGAPNNHWIPMVSSLQLGLNHARDQSRKKTRTKLDGVGPRSL